MPNVGSRPGKATTAGKVVSFIARSGIYYNIDPAPSDSRYKWVISWKPPEGGRMKAYFPDNKEALIFIEAARKGTTTL